MKKRIIIRMGAAIIFVIGALTFLFPHISNYLYEEDIKDIKDDFINNIDDINSEINNDKVDNRLDMLYTRLVEENNKLFENKQDKLVDPFSYEQTNIDLKEYGLKNNIIGFIEIPKIKVDIPIYLGANKSNLNKGAVHLTETSYPIGGVNTKTVIAAHRSDFKKRLFRRIDKLKIGDIAYIVNFREKLKYEVIGYKIIKPNELEDLYIEDGKDLLVLISCHPYPTNKKRYVVILKRV